MPASPFEITSTRVFRFPPEVIFSAFSNPQHLQQWWGPEGFTNTFRIFDFRPGGAWQFTMHGPDGKDYENSKEFIEITPPHRIVFQHHATMHRFRMSMTFAPENNGTHTRLTWVMNFETGGDNTALAGFITHANEQNFDRLEAHLATLSK